MSRAALAPRWLLAAGLVVGVALAQLVPARWLFVAAAGGPEGAPGGAAQGPRYACPMFCAILDELPANGACPVCGMELAPVGATPELDRHEQWMTGLRGAALRELPLVRELRLFGEVAYDEEGLSVVTARSQGWLEGLTAKVTWAEVGAGEPLFELYSPEVFQALQELRVASPRGGELLAAARERLALLGVDPAELDAERLAAAPPRTVTYRAPRAGTIVRRRAVDGGFARAGEELFAVADLGRVWLELDAFEQDLPWLRVGTALTVHDEVRPTQPFEGRVEFLDPVVDRATRTRRVRVSVANERQPDGTWRYLPGARVAATVAVPLAADGGVAVGDGGVAVAAEGVAEGSVAAPAASVLAVPRSAVLRTGARDVLYVLHGEREVDGVRERDYELDPDRLPPRVGYELVEVALGPLARRADQERAEWYYPLVRVRPGKDELGLRRLRAGFVVALDGALLLDSQAQLAGRPSLLFPAGREASPADPHAGH